MHRIVGIWTVLVLVLGGLAASGTATPAGMTWKVAIGGESPDHGIQAQIFAPDTITINAGDTVTWTMAAVFDHTVSFLSGAKAPDLAVPQKDGKLLFNPVVAFPRGGRAYAGTGMASSGVLMGKDKAYSLTFTKPGRYAYVCLLHPGMAGTVVVLAAGKKVPATQAHYDTLGAQQVAAALKQGQALHASAKVSVSKAAKGGAVYTSPMVGTLATHTSVIRYFPESLTVKVGDTIRWVMEDPIELHTVTFSGAQQPPDFIEEKPQPQGPPKLYFNSKVVPPVGGPGQHGNGYYNSGFMMLNNPGAQTTYSLTFTKPGSYTYWCVVHVPQGMKGTIIVQ